MVWGYVMQCACSWGCHIGMNSELFCLYATIREPIVQLFQPFDSADILGCCLAIFVWSFIFNKSKGRY